MSAADDNDNLEGRAKRRQICFATNMEKLVAMRDVKKGTRYRHWLFNQLKALGSGTRVREVIFQPYPLDL